MQFFFHNCIFYGSCLAPDAPSNIIGSGFRDPAGLEVTFSPPAEISRNGDLTGYVIRYLRSGIAQMQNSSSTASLITGLVANTLYTVQVAAVNINGTGPFSTGRPSRSGQDSELTTLLTEMI